MRLQFGSSQGEGGEIDSTRIFFFKSEVTERDALVARLGVKGVAIQVSMEPPIKSLEGSENPEDPDVLPTLLVEAVVTKRALHRFLDGGELELHPGPLQSDPAGESQAVSTVSQLVVADLLSGPAGDSAEAV